MKQLVPTAIAILFGWITLLGYLFGALIGPDFAFHLALIRWAATLAAVAFILGILNLLGVHLRRIANQERDWAYSIVLILSFFVVMAAGAWAAYQGDGLDNGALRWIFQTVLSPLEAAAASLLIFFLVAAAFRAMRKRPSWTTVVFVLTIILVLLGTLPFPGDFGDILASARDWLMQNVAMSGARGILLGVALGTIATGLRVLVGIDRPHSEREP